MTLLARHLGDAGRGGDVDCGAGVREVAVATCRRRRPRAISQGWVCTRQRKATAPTTTSSTPTTSQGRGSRYWSEPLAVAVCQFTVPGPARWTYATYSDSRPTPTRVPNAARPAWWRTTKTIAASSATGTATRPRAEIPKANPMPTPAHAQNQRTCGRWSSGNAELLAVVTTAPLGNTAVAWSLTSEDTANGGLVEQPPDPGCSSPRLRKGPRTSRLRQPRRRQGT